MSFASVIRLLWPVHRPLCPFPGLFDAAFRRRPVCHFPGLLDAGFRRSQCAVPSPVSDVGCSRSVRGCSRPLSLNDPQASGAMPRPGRRWAELTPRGMDGPAQHHRWRHITHDPANGVTGLA